MEGEEEKFSLSLMECTICNEIVHPGCLKVITLGTLQLGWGRLSGSQEVNHSVPGHTCTGWPLLPIIWSLSYRWERLRVLSIQRYPTVGSAPDVPRKDGQAR